MLKTSRLTWCILTHAHKNKHVNIWAQYWSSKLHDDNKRKTSFMHINVCALIIIVWKCFRPGLFYYLTEKSSLSQKLRYFRGSCFPQYQVSVYANNYFEFIPIASSTFKYAQRSRYVCLNMNIIFLINICSTWGTILIL